jgi:hypothetical protein
MAVAIAVRTLYRLYHILLRKEDLERIVEGRQSGSGPSGGGGGTSGELYLSAASF